MPDVWADSLAPELSQGDLIDRVLFTVPAQRDTSLRKASVKGGQGWAETDAWGPDPNGIARCLSDGRLGLGLVVSHSCEIDKYDDVEEADRQRMRVLCAPVVVATNLSDKARRNIFVDDDRIAFVPLWNVPGFGDCYADLRQITSIRRKFIEEATRIASLTSDYRKRLRLKLFSFLARPDEDEPRDEQAI